MLERWDRWSVEGQRKLDFFHHLVMLNKEDEGPLIIAFNDFIQSRILEKMFLLNKISSSLERSIISYRKPSQRQIKI